MMARRTITRTAIVVFAAFGILAISWFAYQFWRARTSESILSKVDQLVLQPPDGVTDLEWAVHVYWTHNLHCNTIPQVYGTRSELLELNASLDHFISAGPDRQTIDTLWRTYSTMSKSGRQYRAKYEAIREQVAREIAEQGDAYFDASSYSDYANSVARRHRKAT